MDHEVDRQAQEDEMEILSEILDADCFTKYLGTTISGKIRIKLRIPWGEVKCRHAADVGLEENIESNPNVDESEAGPSPKKIPKFSLMTLKHLPPLNLHFTLPSDYPSNSKPIFTLSSEWLHRELLTFICGKLDELWEENTGMAILFTWQSFLQEDGLTSLGMIPETVYDLDLVMKVRQPNSHARMPLAQINSGPGVTASSCGGSDDKKIEKAKLENGDVGEKSTSSTRHRVKIGNRRSKYRGAPERLDQRAVFERVPGSLTQFLLEYEKEEGEAEFRRASHMCTICFSEKRGSDCMLFECTHIFCKECLREFLNLHITEGSLDCVKCPDIDCKTVPTPYEIRAIVSPEMFERYDSLLLTKTLDSMSDILHCPRLTCGRPVMYDPSDKLAKCATCGYAFCVMCKTVYHGVEPCRFKSGEAKLLYDKYVSATTDDKKQLEKTYGKKQLELLVQQTLSEEWVTNQSKPCPHCKVPIQKFEGCNKVTCFKCATYFCWICALQLDKQNPYLHFNDPSSPCYNSLFTNVDVPAAEGEDDDGSGSEFDDDDWDESDSDEDYEDIINGIQQFLLRHRNR